MNAGEMKLEKFNPIYNYMCRS